MSDYWEKPGSWINNKLIANNSNQPLNSVKMFKRLNNSLHRALEKWMHEQHVNTHKSIFRQFPSSGLETREFPSMFQKRNIGGTKSLSDSRITEAAQP